MINGVNNSQGDYHTYRVPVQVSDDQIKQYAEGHPPITEKQVRWQLNHPNKANITAQDVIAYCTGQVNTPGLTKLDEDIQDYKPKIPESCEVTHPSSNWPGVSEFYGEEIKEIIYESDTTARRLNVQY